MEEDKGGKEDKGDTGDREPAKASTLCRIECGVLLVNAGVLAPNKRQSSQKLPLHLRSHPLQGEWGGDHHRSIKRILDLLVTNME